MSETDQLDAAQAKKAYRETEALIDIARNTRHIAKTLAELTVLLRALVKALDTHEHD